MYTDHSRSLGAEVQSCVQIARLNERIMSHFPNMQVRKEGRDLLLVSGEDVGTAIKRACQ